MTKKYDIRRLTVSAMLTAVAYLCVFVFRFKVGFLTFDFKDAVIAVLSFLYGPVYGAVSAVLVAFLEGVSVSDTGIYGFIMNALSSGTFACVCGLIYKFKRSFAGAIVSVLSSVTAVTAVMMLANIFITPFYMGVERTDVVAMLPTLLLPFNLCKALMNASVTVLIYKPIATALRRAGLSEGKKLTSAPTDGNSQRRTLVLALTAAAVIAATTAVIIFILGGEFEFLRDLKK